MKTRLDEGEQVDLFAIENTAAKMAYILAKDVETARAIAWSSGHLKHEQNGKCYLCGLDKQLSWGPFISMPAVRRAASERVQGLVKAKGNFVVIRDEVFAPLSGVD